MSRRRLNKHRQTAEPGLGWAGPRDGDSPHSSRDIDTEPKIQTDKGRYARSGMDKDR